MHVTDTSNTHVCEAHARPTWNICDGLDCHIKTDTANAHNGGWNTKLDGGVLAVCVLAVALVMC